MIIQRHRQQEQLQVLPGETPSVVPSETSRATKPTMTSFRHLHAMTLAVALVFGGHYLMLVVGNLGKNSLRGFDESSYQLEKKTNDTIETLITTLREKTVKDEDLAVLLKRVETMEKKLDAPEQHAHKKNLDDALEDNLATVETKLHSHDQADISKANDATLAEETGATTPKVKPHVLNERQSKLLSRFNPKRAPIISKIDPDQPVRVRMLLLRPKSGRVRVRKGQLGLVRDEMISIVLDGLERSPYFEMLEPTALSYHTLQPNFVLQEQSDVVWVVDAQTLSVKGYNYSVVEEVLIAAKATVSYQHTLNATRKPSLKVVFVDYHDRIAGKDKMCEPALEELVKLLGVGNVRDVVGKVVVARHWEKSIGWIKPGTIWDSNYHACLRAPTLRSAYTVRSDYAEAVERLFPKFLEEGGAKPELPTPVDTIRPVDVWHHWDVEKKPERREYRAFSNLRSAVSEIISSFSGINVGGREIMVKAESVSEGGSIGRTKIGQEYLESLLKTKIVVVAQRDAWEDHFRLFEALAGGAMVMTDTMLSLPDGLVDGESVVMFNNRKELRALLLYYLHPEQDDVRLAIARKGFDVAMGHHRSYHRMEEVFFGKQLSFSALPHNNLTASRKENGATPTRLPRKKRTISVINTGNVRQKKTDSLPALPQDSVTVSMNENGAPPKQPPRKQTTIAVVEKGNVIQKKRNNS